MTSPDTFAPRGLPIYPAPSRIKLMITAEKPSAHSQISVFIDTNEARRARAQRIKAAILKDGRFLLYPPRSLPFDLLFRWGVRVVHVEVKDFTGTGEPQSDYVASIVNRTGHLYRQVLAGREGQGPLAVMVPGDDDRVIQAICNLVYNRGIRGQEAEVKIAEYTSMVHQFEAECIGHNIQVWRLQADPWRRMLLNVKAMLRDGDMAAFRPRPAAGERQAVGLSLICGKGVGPARAAKILERFYLSLQPRGPGCYLEDCPGIGPRVTASVRAALFVPPGWISRREVR